MREIEWNNDKPTLIFMYGYPAAGKTTYSRSLYNSLTLLCKDVVLISADQIRELLYGSEDIYGNPEEVFQSILVRMREALMNDTSVIYDATNLYKEYRMDYLNALQNVDCYKRIIRVNTDKETCIERHNKRGRDIPIEKLMKYFVIDQPPTMEEGWDSIEDISYSENYKRFYIASPFFKEENRKNVIFATEILRKMGHTVYLPLEHKILNAWDYPNYEWGKIVFENDINAINDSDIVVVLSYGRESTAGTNWEAGYAYGIGKPVIVVEMPGVTLMSLMLANGRVATLKGIKELKEYDFNTMPLIEDREMEQK